MKVFEFNYKREWAGGVMLIAANDKEEALEYVNKNYSPYNGFWEYSGEVPNLEYTGDKPCTITEYTYVE